MVESSHELIISGMSGSELVILAQGFKQILTVLRLTGRGGTYFGYHTGLDGRVLDGATTEAKQCEAGRKQQ
jgi:hypothetical protein